MFLKKSKQITLQKHTSYNCIADKALKGGKKSGTYMFYYFPNYCEKKCGQRNRKRGESCDCAY